MKVFNFGKNSLHFQMPCLNLIGMLFFQLQHLSFHLRCSCLQHYQLDSFFLSNFIFHLLFYLQFQRLQSRCQDHIANHITLVHFNYQHFYLEMKNHQDLLQHCHRLHSIFYLKLITLILIISIMLILQLLIQILLLFSYLNTI